MTPFGHYQQRESWLIVMVSTKYILEPSFNRLSILADLGTIRASLHSFCSNGAAMSLQVVRLFPSNFIRFGQINSGCG
jgi:hypothetical protein